MYYLTQIKKDPKRIAKSQKRENSTYIQAFDINPPTHNRKRKKKAKSTQSRKLVQVPKHLRKNEKDPSN